MIEIWVPAVGYEGIYEVSSEGRVRSVDREHLCVEKRRSFVRKRKGKPIAVYLCSEGYASVHLSKLGVAKTHRRARIVLASFVPQPDGKNEVCHVNHVRDDDRLENLHWGSRMDNELEKTSSNRRPASTRGVLDKEKVLTAKLLWKSGATYKQIASQLGCHFSTVALAIKGKTWKWVQ